MIRLFINGLAASAGGGLTYLRNVIPHLARRDDVHTTVLLNQALRREFNEAANVSFVEISAADSVLRRLLCEQTEIPRLLRRTNAHVLISAGNFALWNSPVPQILLSRNSLYTSTDFARDVRLRGDYAIWMDTLVKGWLARQSIRRADVTVAPSAAFAGELTEWSGREVVSIHHGFDSEAFASDATPLSAAVQAHLENGRDAVRLLFVSHYNYYRNFESLFRAMPILGRRLKGKRVKLYLTCRLGLNDNPGTYRTEAASGLLHDLRNNDLRNNDQQNNDLRNKCEIVELGSVPYRSLHHLYRACHIYVSPAYAESFAHPLVEAMSSGLPVVASDLAVHREICGSAAIYFSRFSPDELADRISRICESPELAGNLSNNGLHRSQDFSWHRHVSRLLELADNLTRVRAEKCN
jgi:glycosyltransferase involved in cell wall biosynthesis